MEMTGLTQRCSGLAPLAAERQRYADPEILQGQAINIIKDKIMVSLRAE